MGQVGETSLPGRATAHHVVLYQLSQAYGVLDHTVCLLPTRHETHLGPSQWCQEQFLRSPAVFLPEILQGVLVPTGMAEEGPRMGPVGRAGVEARPLLGAMGNTPGLWPERAASSQGTDKWVGATSLCRSPSLAAVLPWQYWKWGGLATPPQPRPHTYGIAPQATGYAHSLPDPPEHQLVPEPLGSGHSLLS